MRPAVARCLCLDVQHRVCVRVVLYNSRCRVRQAERCVSIFFFCIGLSRAFVQESRWDDPAVTATSMWQSFVDDASGQTYYRHKVRRQAHRAVALSC
jgi:hypothetical protein